MAVKGHVQNMSGMNNDTTLLNTNNSISGLNGEDYSSAPPHYNTSHNQTATYDPTWVINSTDGPSRSQSQSADPAWQTHQYFHQPQQYQNTHNTFYGPSTELYSSAFAKNEPDYTDISYNNHAISSTFQLDPSLVSAESGHDALGSSHSPYHLTNTATISPHALQVSHDLTSTDADQGSKPLKENVSLNQRIANGLPIRKGSFVPVIPKSVTTGEFSLIDFDGLVESTKSSRLHNFVNVSNLSYDIPITKTTIPTYIPRKSRNELKNLACGDKKLITKIAKIPGRKRYLSSGIDTGISVAAAALTPKSATSTASASDTASSEDDSSDSVVDDAEPCPLPTERPGAPLEAVRYDTIHSLWRPRNRSISSEQIRKALVDFWEVVRTIRDRWKIDTSAAKQAEEANKKSELPLLRDRVKSQRDMMETAVKAALEFGHSDVIHMLGENPSFIFVLYQFLVDRAKENDYTSALCSKILELLALCTSLTEETLEKTNMLKIITRFMKKTDQKSKALINTVMSNAATASSQKKHSIATDQTERNKAGLKDGKTAQRMDSRTKLSTSSERTAPLNIPGTKRARTSEGLTVQSPKRALSGGASLGNSTAGIDATAKTTLTSTVKRVGSVSSDSKNPTTATATTITSSTNTASKPKGNQVVAKPTNFFSSLQPALRKNASAASNNTAITSGGAKKVVPNTSGEKAQSSTAPVTMPKPSFSFAQMMADVTKPKEPENTVKEESNKLPETAEARARRLRKEERRKLRVTFKPDASLTSVRTFIHDPEEIGHEPQMTRDAGDINGEGRMFKQHKDKLDFDEDEDLPREEYFQEWCDPSEIDFSDVKEEERRRNYKPHGGGMKIPESSEREFQERHEAGTLMVIYTHPSDIPSSPREPGDPFSGVVTETVDIGQPLEETLSRAQNQSSQSAGQDLSAILGLLQNNKQQQSNHNHSKTQAPTELEKIFASFSDSYSGQSHPQQTAHQQQQVQNPLLPQAILQQQQQSTAMPQAGSTPDLQTILAALSGVSQAQPQNQGGVPNVAQSAFPQSTLPIGIGRAAVPNNAVNSQSQNLSALLASLGQIGGGQPNSYATQAQQGIYEDPERKRARESGDMDDRDEEYSKKRKWNGKSRPAGNWPKPQFVVPCKFFKEGKCTKGALCTFLHD